MSPTAEALHIFRKDIRGLWKEICAILFLCAANAAIEITALTPRPDAPSRDQSGTAIFLLIIGVFLVIARVVHAEALPGIRQYWLTRPLRRSSLFCAKLLFLIAFVHAPLALSQIAILVAAGFSPLDYLPGLIWKHILLVLFFDAPALTLAVLTRGLTSFAIAAVVILVSIQGIAQVWKADQLASVAWVGSTLQMILFLAAVASVVILQYRTRSTFRASLIALAGMAVFLFGVGSLVPWNTAWAIQRSLGGEPAAAPSLISTTGQIRDTVPGSQNIEAVFHVVLPQLTGGAVLDRDMLRITLTNDRGGRIVFPTPNIGRSCPTVPGECTFDVSTLLPRAFYEGTDYKARIQYSGEIFLTGYGEPSVETVPESATLTPWRTRDLTCATRSEEGLLCQSPFRWPRDLITLQRGTDPTEMQFNIEQSHSPFPASPGMQALEANSAGFFRSSLGRTTAPGPVRLLRRQPLWHTGVKFDGQIVTQP